MGKNRYSSEVKWAVVKEKIAGNLTTREIMERSTVLNCPYKGDWLRDRINPSE